MGPQRATPGALGRPRLHLASVSSTNERARTLAVSGAPHGTLVTAGEQTAGRGRQGRSWLAPPGAGLPASLVLRDFDGLLSLRAGLAVADVAGHGARVKWPNDVLLDGRKVAGVLVEGRPQAGWAVLGIGLNVAVDPATLPADVRDVAGTLGRRPDELEAVLAELLRVLEVRLAESADATVSALRERDALLGHPVRWGGRTGAGAGIDVAGRLLVRGAGGATVALDAGEVRLETAVTEVAVAGREQAHPPPDVRTTRRMGSPAAMEPIIVRPHGDRWAVYENVDGPPTGEYGTREAAELAARGHVEGTDRDIRVDDTGAEATDHGVQRGHPIAGNPALDQRTGGAGSGADTPREDQAGL